MKAVNRIALIGVLTAVNVTSRELLRFLPNIKPVTSIIILSTIAFGLVFGLELSVTTVLVSGATMGLGIFSFMQIAAWAIIVLLTVAINRWARVRRLLVFTAWAFVGGFVYGFFVSLDKLFVSPGAFVVFYLNGLTFDFFHALGNIVFFPLCYRVLLPIFGRYIPPKKRAG